MMFHITNVHKHSVSKKDRYSRDKQEFEPSGNDILKNVAEISRIRVSLRPELTAHPLKRSSRA